MEVTTDEKFLITKAKVTGTLDPHAQKAWIITAKTLYPNDFGVQFEAYQLEKKEENVEEAARCFSYILMTFQNQQIELWNEISQLTGALRVPDGAATAEQEFYIKMFQHISYEVQHKILILTANHSDNNLEHCRLILLLLKRFPQAITTHAPRLLETIIQGMSVAPAQYQEILVAEALPLIAQRPPELSNHLVNRIMAISFEYFTNNMFQDNDDKKNLQNDNWKKIFEILELCGKMLKWEQFLPYNKLWSKDIYWQKLIQIVSSAPPRPSENKQILFCATIIFVLSLQDYMASTKFKANKTDVNVILVEGFKEAPSEPTKRRKVDGMETPLISDNWPSTPETGISFVTAANCWQLLHSNEILQIDFSQIIMKLPMTNWINRFLLDFHIYLGRHEEITALLNDNNPRGISTLEKNVRFLSLMISSSNITVQTFELIISSFADLPAVSGAPIQNLCATTHARHLVFLPMTKNAILQYCVKIIVNALKIKLISNPNCSNLTLGNLLVLIQLDWPNEMLTAEIIFEKIKERGSFSYMFFTKYVLNIDFIEEFMFLWFPQNGGIQLEFVPPQSAAVGTRRIGTRGADKGVKEDFKHIIKQQIARSNEDIDELVIQFITQERGMLMQNVFEK